MPTETKTASHVWSLAIVIGSVAVIGISSGLFTPLVSLRVEAAGVSTAWNGILAASPSIAILAMGASYPFLMRKLGVLWSFYLSTALAVICALLFPLFDNFWIWLVLRLMMGAALGLQWVVSEAWINGLAAGERRGTILGIFVAVFSAGLAIGPFALSIIGYEGYLPFAISAILLIVCGLPLPFAQRVTSGDGHQIPTSIVSTIMRAPAENIAGIINGASWGTLLALLPLYAIHLGLESGRALQLLTGLCIGSLICQPVVGRLIDRTSPRFVMAICGATQLVVCGTMAMVINSEIAVWPLVLVWGAAIGGMYTAGIAGLGAKFSPGDLPVASTGFTMVWEVGALSGPIVTGIAMQGWDPHGLAVVVGVLGGILLFASARRLRAVMAD
jgi:MFS family permease